MDEDLVPSTNDKSRIYIIATLVTAILGVVIACFVAATKYQEFRKAAADAEKRRISRLSFGSSQFWRDVWRGSLAEKLGMSTIYPVCLRKRTFMTRPTICRECRA